MSDIRYHASRMREMEELAGLKSPVHSLHPLPKLIVTITYILVTTSFSKYDLSGLAVMALYPAVLFALSGISVRTCIRKLRFLLPFVCAVGIFNPFFDRVPYLYIGTMEITGGVVSMITLMIKGVLCLTASFLLVATTSVDQICRALKKLHLPGMLVTLILLTYRYAEVLVEEVTVLTTAYKLRAPGQKGIHHSAWGSFLGQLLLRSMDRAQELYESMLLRGFEGNFMYVRTQRFCLADMIYAVCLLAVFLVCRLVNIAEFVGGMII